MTPPVVTGLDDYRLGLERTALVVVDMQNDFCKPDGFFAGSGFDVSRCHEAVNRTQALLGEVRPLGLQVVWTKSTNPDPPVYELPPTRFRRRGDASLKGVRGSDYFVPGAWGTEIVNELSPAPGDLIIEKPRYSGFYRTALDETLRARGIDTLAVAGVTTNCCVDTTVRDAFIRGFHVCVLADCVAAFAQEWDLHEASLRNLSLLFAVVSTSDELIAALKRSAVLV